MHIPWEQRTLFKYSNKWPSYLRFSSIIRQMQFYYSAILFSSIIVRYAVNHWRVQYSYCYMHTLRGCTKDITYMVAFTTWNAAQNTLGCTDITARIARITPRSSLTCVLCGLTMIYTSQILYLHLKFAWYTTRVYILYVWKQM